MALKVIYCDYKRIKEIQQDVENDYYILTSDNWDDYGYRTAFNVHIIIKGEVYSSLTRKILFEQQKEGEYAYSYFANFATPHKPIVDIQEFQATHSYISLGHEYEELKKLFPDDYLTILGLLNDIVFLKHEDTPSPLLDLKTHPAFETSLCRDQYSKKLLAEANAILYGDVLSPDRFKFDFGFVLDYQKRKYSYTFDFIDNNLPHRINILIGKNGSGKSQTLKVLTEYLAIRNKKTIEKYDIEISDHPNFIANMMVFAYNPYEDFYLPKAMQGDYNYLGFRKRLDDETVVFDKNRPDQITFNAFFDLYERDRNNFVHTTKMYDLPFINRVLFYIRKAVPKTRSIGLKLKDEVDKSKYSASFNPPIQVISATPMLFNLLPKSYHKTLQMVS
jgi:hypothetical protein